MEQKQTNELQQKKRKLLSKEVAKKLMQRKSREQGIKNKTNPRHSRDNIVPANMSGIKQRY